MRKYSTRQLVRDNLKNMGTLPAIVKQLIEVLNNPWSSSKDLAKVISVDPVLTSRLLRLVNSAYYGFVTEIEDLQHAISLAGVNTIRSFAFCMTIFDSFFEIEKRHAFNKEKFWIHCLGVGTAAKYIAQGMRLDNPTNYFMAGLLHDIGKIFQYQFMVRDFYTVVNKAQAYKVSYFTAEKSVMDMPHTEIGRMALEEWQLPEFLRKAAMYHHEGSPDKKFPDIADIILISDNLCKSGAIGFGGDNIISGLYKPLKEKYKITDKHVEDISAKVKEEVEKFSEVINGAGTGGAGGAKQPVQGRT
ncbi:MAG: HDOD domain-containing protein [Firmicutes bacterium]|nr:HDOD domain-containing protein [Bacillota bacterium]